MKKIFLFTLIFYSLAGNIPVGAQNRITLDECQKKASEHSPLQKQKLYLESIEQLNSQSAQAINYPMLQLNAQASYQSDVFSLPFRLPGIDSPIIPQDQYKVAVDFYQNIYNGGVSRSVRKIENAKMEADLQALEVDLYKIREIVNSLYFGILKGQEQIQIIGNTREVLNNQKQIIESGIEAGAALPMSVKLLEKEIVSMDQKLIEIEFARSSLLDMLGLWIETPLDNETVLEIPEPENNNTPVSVIRPESKQFSLQMDLLESQKSSLTASRIPDIGIFGTAGLGYPNPMNWFEVELSPYWMAGIKLSWNIIDYGKASRDREVLGLRQQSLLSVKENFERTVEINMTKQTSDILKYQQLIEKDREIVQLQEEITNVVSSQLRNGIVNSNDYVEEVNKGLNAEITLRLHEIDLSKAKIDLLTLSGNTE